MKSLLLGALAAATLAIPAISFAATYQYVNTQGALENIVANTAEEALELPTDMDPHSGVMLVGNTQPTTTTVSTNNTVVGSYTGQLSGTNTTTARTMYLSLLPDNSVILTSVYADATPTMIESGTWQVNSAGQIQVTLTGNVAGNSTTTYSPTRALIFSQNGSSLTATSYNAGMYGNQAPVFTK